MGHEQGELMGYRSQAYTQDVNLSRKHGNVGI